MSIILEKNIILQKSGLLAALAPIQAAAARNVTTPILANVRIQTRRENQSIEFTATDLDLEVVTRCDAEINGEDFSITTPAAMLYEIVRHISDMEPDISITLEDKLLIRSGNFQSICHTLSSDEFPLMPSLDFTCSLSLPSQKLKRALEQTRIAISHDEARYCLCGLYWHLMTRGQLAIVATDGHRLAKVICDHLSDLDSMPSIIIPKKTIAHLQRLLGESAPNSFVVCHIATGKIQFCLEQATLTSKLIDGQFPDYARAIPEDNNKHLFVATKAILEALSRVTIITSERNKFVTLTLAHNQLTLSSENPDLGSTKEVIAANYEGPDMKISFNARYLSEIIVSIAQDTIHFSLKDAQSAAILKTPKDEKIFYVLMPVCV